MSTRAEKPETNGSEGGVTCDRPQKGKAEGENHLDFSQLKELAFS